MLALSNLVVLSLFVTKWLVLFEKSLVSVAYKLVVLVAGSVEMVEVLSSCAELEASNAEVVSIPFVDLISLLVGVGVFVTSSADVYKSDFVVVAEGASAELVTASPP